MTELTAESTLFKNVPCRGIKTLKSSMPPTAGCDIRVGCSVSPDDVVQGGARGGCVERDSTAWACDGRFSGEVVLLSGDKALSEGESASFRRLEGGAMVSSIQCPPQLP